MSRVDRMWLRMDHPTNLMMITGVTFFEEPVERHAVAEVLRTRLLAIPRFRWRVVANEKGSGHQWEFDDDPDLNWHLQEIALPEPGDDSLLRQFVNEWISKPLDPNRPLWQVHLIQNHNRGSALLWRLHHCIGDGIALMMAMLSLTDVAPPGSGEGENPLRELFGETPPTPEDAKKHLQEVLPEAVKLLSLPAETIESLSRWKKGGASVPAFGKLALRPPDQRTPFRGPLGIAKRVAWSDPIPLAEINQVRQSLGAPSMTFSPMRWRVGCVDIWSHAVS
jgi:WS/DGAT/MGAT family acyltransferase